MKPSISKVPACASVEASLVGVLYQHAPRLQACLQRASGDSHGPEEGSDAWLLLNALIGNERGDSDSIDPDMVGATARVALDDSSDNAGAPFASGLGEDTSNLSALLARLEDSGRHLAEQGGKLEARFQGLQRYIDALATELHELFRDQAYLLVEGLSRLYQLQSACVLALTRGYQGVVDQVSIEKYRVDQQLERRLQALQRINSAANSASDLDQTLALTAKTVAEELHAELCSIFFYDELQLILTLRATNGPRPLGGMHFTLRLGEGYSGWVADKGHPLLVRDALADPLFSAEARTYSADYHGLMAVPIIFFGDVARLIGVVSVQSAEQRDFTNEDISFVEVVAGIIAINIENGLLYEQTDEKLRRKVHELATINRVSSIIASTLNLEEVLQIITTQAVHLSGAERSCIFALDAEQKQLVVIFANEAAIAIDNARLFEETRSGLELKSVLLRELHHRVKNNLATVSGILSLLQRRTKSPEVRRTLAESVNRVQGLAATHDLLSHEDMGEARVDEIARKIVGVANAHLRPPETHITFHVEPCSVVLPSRTVYILALVLNEMISNAIKHGMAGMKVGVVTLR